MYRYIFPCAAFIAFIEVEKICVVIGITVGMISRNRVTADRAGACMINTITVIGISMLTAVYSTGIRALHFKPIEF